MGASEGKSAKAFTAAVDDLACALVPTACSVTLLFYGLLFQDPTLVVESCVHGQRKGRPEQGPLASVDSRV